MNNKGRQLTVGAVGLVVTSLGAFFRLAILDSRTHDFLAMITSLGRFRSASNPLGTPILVAAWPATKTLEALGSMALGVFFAGLMLMVAAVVAWLFTQPKNEHDTVA
jgi:hypothetical protein